MSSKVNDLMLNKVEYRALRYSPKSVEEWFEAWKKALKQKDFNGLLTLLHGGLQLPIHNERKSEVVTRLFCHYLAVADGHQSAKNFGHSGRVGSENDFSAMSHGELMQKLSDKAWMEICNRVFVFSEDGGGLKYSWYFRQPELAAAFIRFIDPERWREGDRYLSAQGNIDRLGKSAYHVKALSFVLAFLREAWQYREIVERENAFFKDANQVVSSNQRDVRVLEGIAFFRKLKPQLATLMVLYGIEGFLHDQKLDHKTRVVLEIFAKKHSTDFKNLADAYGQLDPEYGYLTLSFREVARILILYPSLVRGRRKYVRELVQARHAAKAAEAEELRLELERITVKLRAAQ